jgi:hypothetical protein
LIAKNDLSHIQDSVYNPGGKHTSFGYQTKRKKIELINQEASQFSNDQDESALNQPTSTNRNNHPQIDHSSSVISNRINTTVPEAVE